MLAVILASIIVFGLTLLLGATTYGFYFIIDEVFINDEFKEGWSKMNKKRKVASIIMMLFPTTLYIIVLYLIVDIWIIYLTNII